MTGRQTASENMTEGWASLGTPILRGRLGADSLCFHPETRNVTLTDARTVDRQTQGKADARHGRR
ncbi:hypothetical protein ABU162_00980 [Paenibacillus thiaminolyticus]|uniref:hypothetical protein n=1 Tax=Paenibacillus thiaminolyticus TaxID=49283 RepID=UPI0035A5B9F6